MDLMCVPTTVVVAVVVDGFIVGKFVFRPHRKSSLVSALRITLWSTKGIIQVAFSLFLFSCLPHVSVYPLD